MHVDTAQSAITAVSYGLGVIGLVSVAWTYFRGTAVKTTLEAQAKTIEALEVGMDQQERLRSECQRDIAQLRDEVAILKTLPLQALLDNQTKGIAILEALANRAEVTPRTKTRR